jgi:hypothetical protein
MKLTDIQRREIGRLIRNPKNGGSDRDRDRTRTKLKRLGLIRFDRSTWEWGILPAGFAAFAGREGGEK